MLDSVRVKLTLWYTGVLALILVVFSVGVYALMARKLEGRLDAGLRTALEGTARLFVHEKEEGDTDAQATGSALRKYYFPRQAVGVFSWDGRPAGGQARGALEAALPAPVAEFDRDGVQFRTVPNGEHGVRVVVARVRSIDPKPAYIVIVQSRAEVAADLRLLSGILAAAVPLALLLTALGGWFLARKSLAPVVEMSATAHRISAENLTERLPAGNPRDELGQLAQTFNDLLQRLDASFAEQRRFMADASHELRTPLSVIRTASQVTLEQPHRNEAEYREALAMIEEQATRLSGIVEDMFTLARADAGRRELHRTRFYLDELLVESARAARVLADRKRIVVAVDDLPETPVLADEALLRQLLLNLLDNAVKYTPAGGRIRLQLLRQNGTARVVVADNGPGIPSEAQARVFERFFRVDAARTRSAFGASAGLGLSIARWIAESHGGSLTLQQSGPSGSTFVASLPAELADASSR